MTNFKADDDIDEALRIEMEKRAALNNIDTEEVKKVVEDVRQLLDGHKSNVVLSVAMTLLPNVILICSQDEEEAIAMWASVRKDIDEFMDKRTKQ